MDLKPDLSMSSSERHRRKRCEKQRAQETVPCQSGQGAADMEEGGKFTRVPA